MSYFAEPYIVTSNGRLFGIGYQDFTVGSITGTGVTLTTNSNGTGVVFDINKIISGTAYISTKNTQQHVYTSTTPNESNIVRIDIHSFDQITLSGIPNTIWGDIRIWYAYEYSTRNTLNYILPEKYIYEVVFNNLEYNLARWGEIQGSILDQSDLNNALNSKADKNTTLNYLGTGLIEGCVLTINVDNTKFDISPGILYFIDNTTDPENPTFTKLVYTGSSGNSVTNLTTQNSTFIGLDVDGTIIQQATTFQCPQRRSIVQLGALIHSNRTFINVINNLPNVALDSTLQQQDLMNALKVFNRDGNLIGPNGTNLSINKTEGRIFKTGANFVNDNKSPHTVITPTLTAPTTLRYRLQTGTEYSNTDVVDPSNYDLSGVLTPVPSNKWTIQRFYLFTSNLIRIQYGQHIYNKKADAIQALSNETFVIEQNIADNGLLRGVLIVQSGATDLSDLNQAEFKSVGRFGETDLIGSGDGTTNLQQAYENSIVPQITTSTESGPLTIKNGTVDNSDVVYQIMDNTGNVVATISGNVEVISKLLKVGDTDLGNYTEFEADGTMVAVGDATTWNDINYSAGNLRGGVTPPTWTNIVGGLYGYTFSPILNEELHGCEEVLHDYKEGTDISMHIHWSPTTTNTGTVRWGLEYSWVNIGDTGTGTTTIYVEQPSSGVVGRHQIIAFSDIVGTGKKMGSYLCVRVFRDATHVNDTYTGEAFLPQFGIHYQKDTLGSRQRTSK